MKTLKPIPNLTTTVEPAAVKYWTVQDYHRMSEMGFLAPDERTELINGQILLMASKGTPHVLALRLLSKSLDALLLDRSFFVQSPVLSKHFFGWDRMALYLKKAFSLWNSSLFRFFSSLASVFRVSR
jgi:hypothetical protein